MQDLISFLATYQPDYAKVVQGYPDERIAELEQMVGRPVPAAYRDFLRTAAANLGFSIDVVTFDIDEVIDLAEYKRDHMPPWIYPIAVEDLQPGMDYYLDTSRAPAPGDGMVVSSAAGSLSFDDIRPTYPSLRDMLFYNGFREVRMLTLPCREWVSWDDAAFADPDRAPRRDEIDQALASMGLRRLEVTSSARALYERGDCAAMVVEQMQAKTFIVMLAADDPKTAILAAETLCDSTRGYGERRSW